MDASASTIGDVLLLASAERAARTALWFRGRPVRYAELAARAAALAGSLRSLGLRPGDRVAIYMENSPAYLVAYFGVPLAGMTLVPLNTFLAPAELTGILADCRPALLLGSAASLRKIAPALAASARTPTVILDDSGAPVPALPVDPAPPPPVSGTDPAVILYTSGTTGTPKGVLLSHRALLANARACIEAVGVAPRDRVLLALPMFHSFTQMVGMLTPIVAGMGIVLCEKLDRAEVRMAIRRHRPTIMPAVPAVFAAMAHARLGLLARWLNPVRLYISGGAPLSAETLSSFESNFRRPLCEGYGLSEAGPVVALNPPAGPRKPGSVGRPLPGIQVRIAGPDAQPLAAGETGELLVRSPALMDRYEARPEETASALRDGWLHTGDMARLDEDGYLFVMGRSKEMLIHRGMNVYPREIECVLERCDDVSEAAVIGMPHPSRGEVPVAFVVPKSGAHLTPERLRRSCLASLARYKVPRHIEIVDSLPRNAAGKVLKTELALRTAAQNSGRGVPG